MGRGPASWKAAGSGEEQLDHIFYDTELSTTSANTNLTLFDGTEAASGLDDTNMPIASQLPSSQRFLVKKISVHFNDVLASADAENILDRGSFEMRVNDRRVFACPLREVMSEKTVLPSGVTQDEQYFVGGTYEFENYVHIPGGVRFNVLIETGETAPGASTALTVCLHGELVRSV